MFFACIGGGPLALTYKCINTMDSMFGYKNERYFDFGFVAAKLDDCTNWLPARLGGVPPRIHVSVLWVTGDGFICDSVT